MCMEMYCKDMSLPIFFFAVFAKEDNFCDSLFVPIDESSKIWSALRRKNLLLEEQILSCKS